MKPDIPSSEDLAPLNLAFATRSVPMHGRAPWERDLGGSESALVFAARGLARRGHHVDVFTRCDAPGVYDDVTYHDVEALDQAARIRDWDAFVSLRFPDLVTRDLRAGVRALWCQDVLSQAPVRDWHPWVDLFVFVSQWHRDDTVAAHPGIASDAEVVENCVELSMMPEQRQERDPPLLLHLSRPERGLMPLLELWPSIRARHPQARLGVARYRSFHEPRGSQVEAFCIAADQRVRATPGAEHLGSLSKPALYELMSQAALMVYPADFDETSCIAAIEAQACGLPVAATARGALPETLALEAALLIPQGPRWKQRYADAVADLLSDPQRRAAMSQAGRERAAQHGADAIAARWEEVIVQRLQGRAARLAPQVRRTLAARGDLDAAQWPESEPLPAPGPAATPWPGWGPALWQALAQRLPPGGRALLAGPSAPALDLVVHSGLELERRQFGSAGEPAPALLDWGGLLAAQDRAAYLAWCAAQVHPGAPITHLLPAAPGVVPGQRVHPTYDDVLRWFGEAAEIGWTAEAVSDWGLPAGCWLVSYLAGQAAAKADRPARKRAVTRPVPTVSVCMIVKDGAETLRTTLESVRCIADELHVLDTGSTDGTQDLVRRFAGRVPFPVHLREEPWPDDFGLARNMSLQGAAGDWVLWIDDDERLIGGERLRRLLQSEHFNAYAIKQHNHIFDIGTTHVEIPFRVFRNHQGYRFFGAVHEHPEVRLNQTIEPWTLAQGVDILHYGYLTEPTRRRKLLARNLTLVNKDSRAYPGRLLTDVLYLRDCMNLARFDKSREGRIRPDHVRAMHDALGRFERQFFHERGRYYNLGRQYYDQCLELLGQGHEIVVKVGGKDAKAERHWYRQPQDAVWLAAEAARRHVMSKAGGAR